MCLWYPERYETAKEEKILILKTVILFPFVLFDCSRHQDPCLGYNEEQQLWLQWGSYLDVVSRKSALPKLYSPRLPYYLTLNVLITNKLPSFRNTQLFTPLLNNTILKYFEQFWDLKFKSKVERNHCNFLMFFSSLQWFWKHYQTTELLPNQMPVSVNIVYFTHMYICTAKLGLPVSTDI